MSDSHDQALPWWKGATIYQIYPRSFRDANGDGIGDLPGITERLSYVAKLGVDCIWISPFYKSPMKDFGYDVSDYCAVDPIFGQLSDFDALVERAHALGLKVLIDEVYSHTSDEHDWFCESRSSQTNSKADWYVWADAKPDGSPPSNWQSVFGGPAWTWDARRGQYYLHNFLTSQPQLNLHNRDVQDAVLDVMRFWLDRGVDGFRIDALNFAMHDPLLRDNPAAAPTIAQRTRPFDFQLKKYNQSHADIPAFIRRIRDLTDRYDSIFTVAEVGGDDAIREMRLFTAGQDHLNSAYSFNFLYAPELTPHLVCASLAEWPSTAGTISDSGWPSWAFENHDAPRAISRWCAPDQRDAFARMKMLLLLCLRGNAILYYGEELGLEQVEIPFDQLHDPEAIANWPLTLSRDGARTPMPWSDCTCGGFGSDSPWLPIGSQNRARSVETQERSDGSLLDFARETIAMRRDLPAMRYGSLENCRHDGAILRFERHLDDQHLSFTFNLGADCLSEANCTGTVLLSVNGASIDTLPTYGAIVTETSA